MILDNLKSIGTYGKQISNLTMNLNDSSFISANNQVHNVYKKYNIKSPPDPSSSCIQKEKCGGGYYPTRYSSKNNSLNNKSVYCKGLMSFFSKLENEYINH